jgi:hypothetical protein
VQTVKRLFGFQLIVMHFDAKGKMKEKEKKKRKTKSISSCSRKLVVIWLFPLPQISIVSAHCWRRFSLFQWEALKEGSKAAVGSNWKSCRLQCNLQALVRLPTHYASWCRWGNFFASIFFLLQKGQK